MRIHSLQLTAAALLGGTLVLTGCSSAAPGPATDVSQSPSPSTDAPGDAAGAASPRDTDLAGAAFAMSWTDALDAAAQRFDGEPVSLSLEWKQTAFAYGVELVNDTESYEVVFNADSGELIHEETELESPADIAEKRQGLITPTKLITPADAMAAAVAAVPGPVSEWEIDDENGQLNFEVQILTKTGDTDVRVDAVSGEILEIDH